MNVILIGLIIGLIVLVREVMPYLKSNSMYQKICLMVCGIVLGCALEMLIENFIYYFDFGMGKLIHTGFYYLSQDYYTNYILLGISTSIPIILGIWAGKKLQQFQLSVIKVIPFLFLLSFLLADFSTPSVIKNRFMCGTTHLAMTQEIFSLLSIVNFVLLLIFSKISLCYHKRLLLQIRQGN